MKKVKINNIHIKPLKTDLIEDPRLPKGFEIFGKNVTPNVFFLAMKGKGKTVSLGNILKLCIDDRTIVLVFSPTIHQDKSHIGIRQFCDKKNIEYHGYPSTVDDRGNNILKILQRQLEEESEVREEASKKISKLTEEQLRRFLFNDPEPKIRKRKYKVPDYVIVIDDLREELRSSVIKSLIQRNRHYRIMVILSSQYSKDLHPASLHNIDNSLVFGKQPIEHIKKLKTDFSLDIDLNDLVEMYKDATNEKYSFLFIDINDNKYRKRLNEGYV